MGYDEEAIYGESGTLPLPDGDWDCGRWGWGRGWDKDAHQAPGRLRSERVSDMYMYPYRNLVLKKRQDKLVQGWVG